MAKVITHSAEIFLLALLASLFLARGSWRSENARRGVVDACFATVLALGIALVIHHVWDRSRPFVAHPAEAHLLLAHARDASFPSDNATGAFAIAVSLLLRHRAAGLVALAVAILVAVSRVAIGVHYPSDVAGGALLGTLVAVAFWAPHPLRDSLDEFTLWVSSVYDRIANRLFGSLESPT